MKRSYDSTGVSLDTNFVPAPEGVYWLRIVKTTDQKDGMPWKTRNGDDYVSVECEIDDQGDYFGKKVWHGVTIMDPSKPGAGMAVKFLKSIGEPWEGQFDIDTDNWIDKKFRARLDVGKNNKGQPRNEIAYLVDDAAALDEVPF